MTSPNRSACIPRRYAARSTAGERPPSGRAGEAVGWIPTGRRSTELQAKGYTGKLSILRDDIRSKRALARPAGDRAI